MNSDFLMSANGIDLEARGIDEIQGADLRARLRTFAEDWNRPEADIYDEDPPKQGRPIYSSLKQTRKID